MISPVRAFTRNVSGGVRPETRSSPNPGTASISISSGFCGASVKSTPAASAGIWRCTTTAMASWPGT